MSEQGISEESKKGFGLASIKKEGAYIDYEGKAVDRPDDYGLGFFAKHVHRIEKRIKLFLSVRGIINKGCF